MLRPPRTRSSAERFGCASPNPATVPVTTPCCWRRRRRRVRAIAWSISAPGWALPGLALAKRVSGIKIVLVEIDEALAALARGNAAANGIEGKVVTMDIASSADAFAAAGLSPDSVDAVLMNPPFNDSRRHRASPDKGRETAHVADATTLERWVHAARRILKSGGVLTLIWRADALGGDSGGARSRLWQPRDPAGARRSRHARDSRADSCRQSRQGADLNLCRRHAQ